MLWGSCMVALQSRPQSPHSKHLGQVLLCHFLWFLAAGEFHPFLLLLRLGLQKPQLFVSQQLNGHCLTISFSAFWNSLVYLTFQCWKVRRLCTEFQSLLAQLLFSGLKSLALKASFVQISSPISSTELCSEPQAGLLVGCAHLCVGTSPAPHGPVFQRELPTLPVRPASPLGVLLPETAERFWSHMEDLTLLAQPIHHDGMRSYY